MLITSFEQANKIFEFQLNKVDNKNSLKWRKIKKLAKIGSDDNTKKVSSPIKTFISKLSKGLMVPIAMLPIAGLFLGIGTAIANNSYNDGLVKFGNILQILGNAVFNNLAILFCIAIAISFTNDAGVAGLSSLIAWIIFCSTHSAFITHIIDPDVNKYKFLFYTFNPTQYHSIFTTNVGIDSLNTGIFGGIAIGCLTAFLYNKFKNIQLPAVIGFFSGVRFIPIITFLCSFLFGVVFSIIWPVIGLGIYEFGKALAKIPYGINSLIFGYTERALIPFGLHHAFYIPLWQTAAGGMIDLNCDMLINGQQVYYNGELCETWLNFVDSVNPQLAPVSGTISGDQNAWQFVNSLSGIKVNLGGAQGAIYTISFSDFTNNIPLSTCNPGQYMQGKYSFMMFGLPAAGIAMIMAAPKGKNRKYAFPIIISSTLTSFLTGITEPIEFTFIFLLPSLYYGFHCVMAGISFWLANLWGAHVGMTFSGGFIDWIIYGLLSDVLGSNVGSWKLLIVGVGMVPIYYMVFYLVITKFDVQTPGRGTNTKLFTKKDYLAAKSNKKDNKEQQQTLSIDNKQLNEQEQLAVDIISAYGGKENIKNVDACITRLRIEVVDQNKVNTEKLMELGAHGISKPSATSVHAIFGTKSDVIKNSIRKMLENMK